MIFDHLENVESSTKSLYYFFPVIFLRIFDYSLKGILKKRSSCFLFYWRLNGIFEETYEWHYLQAYLLANSANIVRKSSNALTSLPSHAQLLSVLHRLYVIYNRKTREKPSDFLTQGTDPFSKALRQPFDLTSSQIFCKTVKLWILTYLLLILRIIISWSSS